MLKETGDAVESVEIMTSEGEYKILKRGDLSFGYRWSSFQEMSDLAVITAVTFKLKVLEIAKKNQQEYLERRRCRQPLGERSAGSVFRNPQGTELSAAQLIERAGLKGCRVGGAVTPTSLSTAVVQLAATCLDSLSWPRRLCGGSLM
ncbi:uncharacterized protein LOC131023946 [Salvia miltiorrhiza]|uniref:uncharacterized protein LOC131023946 n=1 Tax=Salvia miltiorrhiza TaxID=226208 RepID=UPI0025ACAF4D|nr:uncharacterized protein LOC131023946 [Salvia miltiorrhiza]